MDCQERLKWFEQHWKEDRRRWEEEKGRLEERLKAQSREIVELRRKLTEQEHTLREEYRRKTETLQRTVEEQQEALHRCERALQKANNRLEGLSQPPLGEGFFRYLAQALEIWDQTLVEQARELQGNELEHWIEAVWEERKEALSRALGGKKPDWRRIRTGLVLEWALLAWLEGVRDGGSLDSRAELG
jgi:chromosome segregation ATPase